LRTVDSNGGSETRPNVQTMTQPLPASFLAGCALTYRACASSLQLPRTYNWKHSLVSEAYRKSHTSTRCISRHYLPLAFFPLSVALMASLNTSTNGPSISKSYQHIVNSGPPSGAAASSPTYGQWAVFSVAAPLVNAFQQDSGSKESVLKVQTSGGKLAPRFLLPSKQPY
jgi:hypothetical protein